MTLEQDNVPPPDQNVPSSPQSSSISIHQRSRSPSISSDSMGDSISESTAALILVPDDADNMSLFDAEDEDDPTSAPTSFPRTYYLSGSLPRGLSTPLTPSSLLFFLLAPVPLLGATLIPESLRGNDVGFNPKALGFLWILCLCILAQVSNQIWIMLGRYVRKWSIEDITAHALTGGDGKKHGLRERWRRRLSKVFGVANASLCALICIMYLRYAVDVLLTGYESTTLLTRVIATTVGSILITPFIIPTAITSKWLSSSVMLSVAAYITVVISMATHRPDTGPDSLVGRENGNQFSLADVTSINWDAFATIAFASASPLFTYPLYASHLASRATNAESLVQKRRVYPYSIYMVLAALISFLFLLPWYYLAPNAGIPHPIPLALCLIFGIPPVWTISLSPRLPSSRTTRYASTIRYGIWILIILISTFMPPIFVRFLLRLLIFAVLSLTYLLPAVLHIFEHNFYPPLSILVNDEAVDNHDPEGHRRGDTAGIMQDDPNSTDSLLQRKERSLQRRRLGRRILWDMIVWIILLPFGIIITAWATGSVLRF